MPSTDVLEVRIDELEKATKSDVAAIREDIRDVRADLKDVLGELKETTRSIDETFKKLVALETRSQTDGQAVARAFSAIAEVEKGVSEMKLEQAKTRTQLKIVFAIVAALLPALGFVAQHFVRFP